MFDETSESETETLKQRRMKPPKAPSQRPDAATLISFALTMTFRFESFSLNRWRSI